MGQGSKLTQAQRRKEVWRLYIAGWQQHAIADKLGVDKATICRDLSALYDEDQKLNPVDKDKLIRLADARLEALWEAAFKPALEGDQKAMANCIKIQAERRRLRNLDPKQVIEVQNTTSLSPEELKAKLLAALADKKGASATNS